MPVQHLYTLVKCVPNPDTGEFVTIGALVGDPTTGEWKVRTLADEGRARRFAGAEAMGTCHLVLERLMADVDRAWDGLMEGSAEALGHEWIEQVARDHRNLVQFTQPLPVVAEDVDAAVDKVFRARLVERESRRRHRVITKHTMRAAMRDAYRDTALPPEYVHENTELVVGDRVHTPLDFAVANGQVLQIAQGWSFQLAGLESVATQVKAWAYALERLQHGDGARLLRVGGVSDIGPEVAIDVLVATPGNDDPTEVYDEARQVFGDLGATVWEWNRADDVARKAQALIQAHRDA